MPSRAPRQSTRALLVLTTATALQNAKDWHGAAYDAALVEPRPSKACGGGLGVFAVTQVPSGGATESRRGVFDGGRGPGRPRRR